MRPLTAHQAKQNGAAESARYYSLGLPSWADPPAGASASRSGATRKPGWPRQLVRNMRHHATGIGR